MYKQVCGICFKTFEAENRRRKYCSHECYNKAKHKLSLEGTRRREITKEVQYRTKSLSEIAKAAAEAGMSYGKYVEAYLRG